MGMGQGRVDEDLLKRFWYRVSKEDMTYEYPIYAVDLVQAHELVHKVVAPEWSFEGPFVREHTEENTTSVVYLNTLIKIVVPDFKVDGEEDIHPDVEAIRSTLYAVLDVLPGISVEPINVEIE